MRLPRLDVVARVVRGVTANPSNEGRVAAAIGRALGWQLWRRVTHMPLTIEVFGGARLHVYPGQHSAVATIYAPLPDYTEMTFLRRVLRPGDGFLDIGANVGVYTLLAATCVGRDGHIIAVEPSPNTCWHLRENVASNQLHNVTVIAKAVADRDGYCRLTHDAGTMNHVLEIRDDVPDSDWIPTITIDGLPCDTPPMFGKIDIEGLELTALRGAAERLLERRPAAWVLEANECLRRYGFTRKDLWDLIEASGGRICLYDVAENTLHPIGEDSKATNIIAVMDPEVVMDRLGTNSRFW